MIEDDLRSTIERVIRDHLQSAFVRAVHAVRSEDFDGDDIIRVTIVVDGPASAFDPHKLAGLATHLREELSAINEDDFPMVSFMMHGEYEQVAA